MYVVTLSNGARIVVPGDTVDAARVNLLTLERDWLAQWTRPFSIILTKLENGFDFVGKSANLNRDLQHFIGERAMSIEQALKEYGCVLEKREDSFGDTKSGWWLDTVFIGSASDAYEEVLTGE